MRAKVSTPYLRRFKPFRVNKVDRVSKAILRIRVAFFYITPLKSLRRLHNVNPEIWCIMSKA